jgi:hypothetical protein
MKRSTVVRIGFAAAALALLPAAYIGLGKVRDADAQGFPPPPPTTWYGPISLANPGQGIIAAVSSGGSSTTCGWGAVLSDSGSTVYVIDVVSDDQIKGCGASGRTVQFYVPSNTPGQGGRVSTNQVTWQGPGAHQATVSLGAQLGNVLYTPQLAAKVTN